jgi:hypothetical protein
MRAVQIVGILLLAALLLAGCREGRTPMETKFAKVDEDMANLEVGVAPSRGLLAKLTREYISLVRTYADDLGPAEARRRLEAKENELQAYCLPCSAIVTQELAHY